MMNYQDKNMETINAWIKEGWEWGKPIDHETYVKAVKGEWNVKLTPCRYVPHSWFGDLEGKKVLGLASGGAQQMPIFCALKGDCTVLDYSDLQLESERKMAEQEGYDIKIVKADMSKTLPFADESFDLIFHPVSNCYIEEVKPLWKECFRILKHGGVLLAGFDNGINYLFDDEKEMTVVNSMPFNPLKNEEQMKQLERDDSGVQFSHSLEEQIGGQLEAGFVIKELYEDYNGTGHLNDLHIPTYMATRSIKG
ncbi:MAG: class I SAM-dependent methyltransferase [Erysipelotrichaceae bacterium]|nr:class I SAM-dependent methyltransferase [Erysipelotrichaceae bacterium]